MTSKEINIVVENKILTFPNLHDAEIVRISPSLVDSKWQLEIDVVSESVDKFEFEFFNVRNLICNNLNFQNVISNVYVLSPQDILDDIERYRKLLGIISHYEYEYFVSELKKKNFFLVEFSPSAGVEVTLLCDRMKITASVL